PRSACALRGPAKQPEIKHFSLAHSWRADCNRPWPVARGSLSGAASAPRRARNVIARTRLGRSIAVALSIALSQIAAPRAQAADAAAPAAHLLKSDQVTARLAERAAERQAQVALVQDVLGGSEARKQAGAMGVDVEKLRSAVPHLSDGELKDLS